MERKRYNHRTSGVDVDIELEGLSTRKNREQPEVCVLFLSFSSNNVKLERGRGTR